MRARWSALGACVLAIAAIALPSTASARTVNLYAYSGDFVDGTGSAGGTLRDIAGVAINQQEGKLLVLDRFRLGGTVSQFSLAGAPIPFGAVGTNAVTKISTSVGALAMDNSGGAANGNFYVETGNNTARGWTKAGAELTTPFPLSGFQQSCGAAVDHQGDIWVTDPGQGRAFEFTPLGVATGAAVFSKRPCEIAIDGDGNFYLGQQNRGDENDERVRKYDSAGNYLYDVNAVESGGIAVDPSDDSVFVAAGGSITHYDSTGALLSTFGEPDPSHSFLGIEGEVTMAVNPLTHEVYVGHSRDYSGGGGGGQNAISHVDIFERDQEIVIPTVLTSPPVLAPTTATLKGSIDLDGGGATTECLFEWGTTVQYGNTLPCDPTGVTDPGVHEVTAELGGLVQGATYNYRLIARNANGVLAAGVNRAFRPQGPASVSDETVSGVLSDGVRFEAEIDPNGGDTSYAFEYGLADCELGGCSSTPVRQLANPLGQQHASEVISGLAPGTAYHFRLVASNAFGTTEGADQVFNTYPKTSAVDDCDNAAVRKQTGAGLLLDCRAYELASAANAGGYDVVSDLVAGQEPLQARPRAGDQVLYSLNFGMVPGIGGNPTNLGGDPYVARRGSGGWTTSYGGIPAAGIPSDKPFGSPVIDSDSGFGTVAFGGGTLCSPCFDDDSVGIPVRLPNGNIVQGMAGSLDPGPAAESDGFIAKRLSADGSHLIFGSASKFEPDGNDNGDVSIYSRDLETGETEVVSKAANGSNLVCLGGAGTCHGPDDPHGIGALGVSADGARVLVAQRVSTDAEGNNRWHPYMRIEGNPSTTIDLAPGTSSGVLFAGMNEAGTVVYFVSDDNLTDDDGDGSADLFRSDVGASSATLTRVSTGSSGAGNTDVCDPVSGGTLPNWNRVDGATDCSVVAIAGGGGVSSGNGTVYFLSPELLDGPAGTAGEPNLYRSAGSGPEFVATIEPGNGIIENAMLRSEEPSSQDFQITPAGGFAVFSSGRSLTGYPQFGHTAIFRDSPAGLDCVSCPPSGAGLTSDTVLSGYGSNLADDGRVFYSTTEQLVLRDTAGVADVYEWSDGVVELISTGISPTPAGLVTVSANGVDVFFYTRETHSALDRNGGTMKVYDAREDGGFLTSPSQVPCQASDECHGPGTVAAPPPAIGTFLGTGGNAQPQKSAKKCKRGSVKKNGKCVKKKKKRKRTSAKRRRR